MKYKGAKRRKQSTAKIVLAGDPLLSVVCDAVQPGEDTNQITRDMMHVLQGYPSAVGLSANQAGHNKRIILVKPAHISIFYSNPSIMEVSDETEIKSEGCLSYPGINKLIERHIWIILASETGVCKYYDWYARIIQHEIDHLDGICKVSEATK